MTPKERRIKRLKNRIRRTKLRLEACNSVKSDPARKTKLLEVVSTCDRGRQADFEELVDRVIDWLDEKIEPEDPLLEWLSDVGIDLVAHAAVSIYKGTERRLARRLARDRAKLERLVGR